MIPIVIQNNTVMQILYLQWFMPIDFYRSKLSVTKICDIIKANRNKNLNKKTEGFAEPPVSN